MYKCFTGINLKPIVLLGKFRKRYEVLKKQHSPEGGPQKLRSDLFQRPETGMYGEQTVLKCSD